MELKKLCLSGEDSALSLVWPLTHFPGTKELQNWIESASLKLQIPILASSLPLFTHKEDRENCNLMWAIRHKRTLKNLGFYAQANGERRLLSDEELLWHHAQWQERKKLRPENLLNDPFQRSVHLRARHHFSLHELHYEYPQERLPLGKSRSEHLRELTFRGLQERYPEGAPPEVLKQIHHELRLIKELKFEDYFLTIYDTLDYARKEKILFQGRGSAANSVVCYCLGITPIDPVRMQLLFERFLSIERNEPPDIDVDFEHERREEVLQELYTRYGRKRAAMVSTYIRFRGRMAVRETGKAMGLKESELEALALELGHEGFSRIRDREEPPDCLRWNRKEWQQFLRMARGLLHQPRHLGIHSSGFVLASEPLTELCILEPARKENRSVIPWDKNDVEYLKWIKVDFLSLGMLTAVRKTFDLIGKRNIFNEQLSIAKIPVDCKKTFADIRRADTVGVFQIESRAQMNMLPRLAPKNFYDLVVEIAIVRPGPLQGGMVHPYIRRRMGLDPVTYDHPLLEPILGKTLGIPIFQEQVMKIAVHVADFTGGEADEMRRIMSGAWKYEGKMHRIREKLTKGILSKGLSLDFANRIYKQIEGFGVYGFPESHSASFAILTYVSSWLKTHHPAEFLCALLNSQPMGFYSPRALVSDAERHGVAVLPPDILHSRWDSTLEFYPGLKSPAVRIGLGLIRGLPKLEAEKIEELQEKGLLSPKRTSRPELQDLRLFLSQKALEILARARALQSLSNAAEPRPGQMWELWGIRKMDLLQKKLSSSSEEKIQSFPNWTPWESLMRDYESLGFKTAASSPEEIGAPMSESHPVAYSKKHFYPKAPNQKDWVAAGDLSHFANGQDVYVLGLMSMRQKPPTAKGLCFITMEDESGFFNLVLMPDIYEKFRPECTRGGILGALVKIQKSQPGILAEPQNVAISLLVKKLWRPEQESSLQYK